VFDASGNSSSCTANVTVVGTIPSCSITAIPGSGPYTGGPATTVYLGYGPQTVTLSGSATGGGGFTYSWSGLSTGLLSCTNCASPVFTPNSEGRYQFTLTATNSNGCSTTCMIEICVLDIRVAGSNNKVYLCHVPPGNPNNPQTLSISVNAVPAHIPGHVGDHLGKCSQSCDNLEYKTGGEEGELIVTDGVSFETIVYPNPFSSDFTVTVETESLEPIQMKIYDLTGRMMMEVKDVASNAPVKVSNDLKDGFYMLQIHQGDQVQNIKIIKRR
jgi:PKD repeat protein